MSNRNKPYIKKNDKEREEVVNAFNNGAKIENWYHPYAFDGWIEDDNPTWNWDQYEYRIKVIENINDNVVEIVRHINYFADTLQTLYYYLPGWKYYNVRQSNDINGNAVFELVMKKGNDSKTIYLDEYLSIHKPSLSEIVDGWRSEIKNANETKGVKNIDTSYYKDDHHDNYKVYIENKVTKEQYIWMIVYSEFDAKSWTKEIKTLLEVYEEKFRGM